MKKETIICDHCGKEIGRLPFLQTASIDFRLEGAELIYDLCDDCGKKMEQLLDEFCPNGGTSKLPF